MQTETLLGDAPATRIGGLDGASYTAVAASLDLPPPVSDLAYLPIERRALSEFVREAALASLSRWAHFSFELPHSAFDETRLLAALADFSVNPGYNVELVALADLCVQPADDDELNEITVDPETGENRPLDQRQLIEIREYGTFSFASRSVPNIRHVWKLPSWLVHGSKNVTNDFHRRFGFSLDDLLFRTQRRLYSRPDSPDSSSPSIAHGIKQATLGVAGIIDSFIGFPKLEPKERHFNDRRLAEFDYVRSRCESTELSDYLVYSKDYDWTVSSSIRREREQQSIFDESYRLAALDAFASITPEDLVTPERIDSINVVFEKNRREKSVQGLLASDSLTAEHKQLLVEKMRAGFILDDGEHKLDVRYREEMHRLSEEAKMTHPVLALSQEWLRTQIYKKIMQTFSELRREQENSDIELIRSSGLHRAAKFEAERLHFDREEWPRLREVWLADMVPAREFEHHYERFDNLYEDRVVRTTTRHFGWRLILIWRDTYSFLRSGVYVFLIQNLWRGPLGIQALLSWNDVRGAWDPNLYHMSMVTRIQAIWRRVRELRNDFEDGTYVVGKDAIRWIHVIVNYVCRGGISTALVVIGQPTLTLLNVVFSVLLAATSVVWAPFSALLTYAASVIIFDWRYSERQVTSLRVLSNSDDAYITVSVSQSPRWFPIPGYLLHILFGGIETVVSALGVMFHPICAAGRAGLACLQRGSRLVLDKIWGAFLKKFGRWPSRDSFMAKRIKGPGISESYFFRLSTDLVTRCLTARMELIELEEAHRLIRSAIEHPVTDIETFAQDVLLGLGAKSFSWTGIMQSLKEEESRRLKQLDSKFQKRIEMLSRLTRMPEEYKRIRPEKGQSVEALLISCERTVADFLTQRIEPLGKIDTNLWVQAGAVPGDTMLLTRYLLTDMFSQDFLVPLDTSDETVEIPIKFENVINVYG